METHSHLTPPYFRYTIRLLSLFPNFDQPFIRSLRRTAVRSLHLPSGARVLDVGCGTGAIFPYLADAVGPTGEVVGVEISREVAAVARKRVEANNWSNVNVIESDARTVVLAGKFDGMVLFGAPDVYASREALTNLLPYLKDGAPIAAFGSKLTRQGFGRLFNPVNRSLMRLSFASTPKLDYEPWTLLREFCDDIEVRPLFSGSFFLATGSKS